jgi:hypothetical protein
MAHSPLMIPHQSSRGGATWFNAVIRRVFRALLALPLQVVAFVRSTGRRSVDPSTGLVAPRDSGLARSMIGLAMALVANVAALVLVFSLARAAYYLFWAAGASPDELARSWGGPSALGATLVHWLVAGAVIVVSYAVIVFAERRASEGT